MPRGHAPELRGAAEMRARHQRGTGTPAPCGYGGEPGRSACPPSAPPVPPQCLPSAPPVLSRAPSSACPALVAPAVRPRARCAPGRHWAASGAPQLGVTRQNCLGKSGTAPQHVGACTQTGLWGSQVCAFPAVLAPGPQAVTFWENPPLFGGCISAELRGYFSALRWGKTPRNSCVEQRSHLVSPLGKLRHGTGWAPALLLQQGQMRRLAGSPARLSCVLVLRLLLLHPSDRGRTSRSPAPAVRAQVFLCLLREISTGNQGRERGWDALTEPQPPTSLRGL